jgi:hypothetical protein
MPITARDRNDQWGTSLNVNDAGASAGRRRKSRIRKEAAGYSMAPNSPLMSENGARSLRVRIAARIDAARARSVS